MGKVVEKLRGGYVRGICEALQSLVISASTTLTEVLKGVGRYAPPAADRVQPGRAHAVGFSPVRVGMRPAASSTAHSPYRYLIISPLIGQKL